MPLKTPSQRDLILAEWAWKIRRLSDRDTMIYSDVMWGKTHEEVAQRYGLARNTVSQIVAKVKARYEPPDLPDD